MHINSFNKKEFNMMYYLYQQKTHVRIQCVNDDECMKIILKIKVLSLLLIMNLQVIINSALCIMRELTK